MRTYDLSPLYRSTVGFDRLTSIMDNVLSSDNAQSGYPPYNIEKLDENSYRVSVAVAGFAESDLTIEARDGQLVISGKKADESKEGEYLHRGIATRAFEKRFQMADHVRATTASIENGLLHVELVREVPEALKPRKIEITTGGQIEGSIEV